MIETELIRECTHMQQRARLATLYQVDVEPTISLAQLLRASGDDWSEGEEVLL